MAVASVPKVLGKKPIHNNHKERPPAGKQPLMVVPASSDLTVRPVFLRQLRDIACPLCAAQPRWTSDATANVRVGMLRAQPHYATCRRCLTLYFFSVFLCEAVHVPRLPELHRLQTAYSRARLPLLNLTNEAGTEGTYRLHRIKPAMFYSNLTFSF